MSREHEEHEGLKGAACCAPAQILSEVQKNVCLPLQEMQLL